MYRVIVSTCPFDKDKLNDMYYQGWELVSVVYCRGEYGQNEFIHYFKRIIQNNKKEEKNEGDKDGVCYSRLEKSSKCCPQNLG